MIKSNEDFLKLLNYAYFFLKFRLRTEKEICQYLEKKAAKKNLPAQLIETVIVELKEQGLVDDKKFIEAFIEQRKLIKPKGKYVLYQELLKHGVAKQLIDDYFATIELDEEALAEQTLKKRWPRWKSLPYEKRYQKASQFLLRRGFDFDLIKKTIAKMLLLNNINHDR